MDRMCFKQGLSALPVDFVDFTCAWDLLGQRTSAQQQATAMAWSGEGWVVEVCLQKTKWESHFYLFLLPWEHLCFQRYVFSKVHWILHENSRILCRDQEDDSESLKQVALPPQVVSEQKFFWSSQSHMRLEKSQIYGKLQIIITLIIYQHHSSATCCVQGFTNTSHLIHLIYLHQQLCNVSISSSLLETRQLRLRF